MLWRQVNASHASGVGMTGLCDEPLVAKSQDLALAGLTSIPTQGRMAASLTAEPSTLPLTIVWVM